MKYKTKQTLKTVLASVLALVVVGGAIGLTASLINKNDDGLKEIHPSFEVGGLTNTGKYEETKYSIYTKDSFECQGLKVELAFDSNVEYSAFFYDTNGNHLNRYTELDEVYSEGHTFEVPAEAVYARLEVTPIWDADVEEEDKELGFFDIAKYANQLTIKVNNDQPSTFDEKLEDVGETSSNTLFDIDYSKCQDGVAIQTADGAFLTTGFPSMWITDYLAVSAGTTFKVSRAPYKMAFYNKVDSNITFVSCLPYNDVRQMTEFTVPDGANCVILQFTEDNADYDGAAAVSFESRYTVVCTQL